MNKERKITLREKQKISLKKNWKTITLLLFAIILVVSLWFWNYHSPHEGAFGDKFGMVNALFSGLAFAGIIITIFLQMSELSLQRDELRETKEVFIKQSEIMKSQQSESTFFHLLDNHRKVIDSLSKGKLKSISGGRRSFGRKGYTTEKISGYEIIDANMSFVYGYLDNFRELMNTGKCLNIKRLDIDPESLIETIPDAESIYKEVLHIVTYIQTYINDEKKYFCYETLERSLSESEKWLLAIYATHMVDNQLIYCLPEIHDIKDYYNFNGVGTFPLVTKYNFEINGERNELSIEIENIKATNFRIIEIVEGELRTSESINFIKEENNYHLDFYTKLFQEKNGFFKFDEGRLVSKRYLMSIEGIWRMEKVEIFSEFEVREVQYEIGRGMRFQGFSSIDPEDEGLKNFINKL